MLLGCLWHLHLPFIMTISVELIGYPKRTIGKEIIACKPQLVNKQQCKQL